VSGSAARHVVLYDGDCGFCTRWRDRMIPRDREGRIEWLSVHDPSVAARFPNLDREDAMRQMYVYAPDGTVHKGADGWMELFRLLHGLSFLAALGRIPGADLLARRVYRFIAERRYRLSCAGAACRTRPPSSREGGGSGPARAAGSGGARSARLALLLPAAGLLAGSVLAALAPAGCSPAPADPLAARLKDVAEPQAAAVVTELLEAYGGYRAWSDLHNVEYHYRLEFYGGEKTPQKVTRQIHRLGLGRQVQAYVEDLDGAEPQVVRLDGEGIEVTRGGVPVTEPSELDFPRAFSQLARWSFLIPWNLLDSDHRLEYRGVRTPPAAGAVPAGPCEVIRLRFDKGDTQGPTLDWYDFYVSRLSHLLDRIHSYRAEDGTYRVSIWSDHLRFGALRVATRRETYASEANGEIGPLEVVAEYSDVRFDAPFKDDVFRGPAPLAASAGPE